MGVTEILDRGLVPDPLIRWGIRRRLRSRLDLSREGSLEERQERFRALLANLRESPIAIHTDAANEQHYELPPAFFRYVLGRNLKYSSGYWDGTTSDLNAAEEAMLARYEERARIEDGQRILDLGCGWGSFSLWIAPRYPDARITAVSNSAPQRAFIENEAKQRGITNLEVITCDVNDFESDELFDRVVSVEMFEHVRNYEHLLDKISRLLVPEGLLFVHIFSHREGAYPFEVSSDDDWMAKHFFTGGMMPSDALLLYFQRRVELVDHWRVDGTHYGKTSEAWLQNMDRNRAAIEPVLAETYGADEVRRWWTRWRVFFMACAELWSYDQGREWLVSHYLFRNRRRSG